VWTKVGRSSSICNPPSRDVPISFNQFLIAIDAVDDLAELRHVVLLERFPVRSCQTSPPPDEYRVPSLDPTAR
jgi:hypothetical protein